MALTGLLVGVSEAAKKPALEIVTGGIVAGAGIGIATFSYIIYPQLRKLFKSLVIAA
ncbi:MAG: hypothetical protein IPH31_17660 [Lewinellaceae bacterium]|nr:hypothetical protein [Lewinellaceae bacterium]